MIQRNHCGIEECCNSWQTGLYSVKQFASPISQQASSLTSHSSTNNHITTRQKSGNEPLSWFAIPRGQVPPESSSCKPYLTTGASLKFLPDPTASLQPQQFVWAFPWSCWPSDVRCPCIVAKIWKNTMPQGMGPLHRNLLQLSRLFASLWQESFFSALLAVLGRVFGPF